MNALSLASDGERFLTLAQAASLLSISMGVAYSLVRSGELPAIRIGRAGRWRVEREVLETYIEAKYEESRRRSLWGGSNLASIAEIST